MSILKYYKVDSDGKIKRLRRECPSAQCGAGIFVSHFVLLNIAVLLYLILDGFPPRPSVLWQMRPDLHVRARQQASCCLKVSTRELPHVYFSQWIYITQWIACEKTLCLTFQSFSVDYVFFSHLLPRVLNLTGSIDYLCFFHSLPGALNILTSRDEWQGQSKIAFVEQIYFKIHNSNSRVFMRWPIAMKNIMLVNYTTKWSVQALKMGVAASEYSARSVDYIFWRVVPCRAHSDSWTQNGFK